MAAQPHTNVYMEMLETSADTLQESTTVWHSKMAGMGGIAKWQAWQWANTRKGYWRTVHSPILTRAISNVNLKRAHYPSLMEYYEKMHPC